MADKEASEQASPPPPSTSNKKLIIFGLIGLLVVGGGAGGGAYYFATKSAQASVAAATQAATEPELPKEAVYVPIHPEFTVNFQEGGSARFLQLSLEAMTRDADVAELIKTNLPLIRSNLVMILSSKTSDDLRTPEGKEALRSETLAGIQEVVIAEGGNDGAVEEVYFTSFVMQ